MATFWLETYVLVLMYVMVEGCHFCIEHVREATKVHSRIKCDSSKDIIFCIGRLDGFHKGVMFVFGHMIGIGIYIYILKFILDIFVVAMMK